MGSLIGHKLCWNEHAKLQLHRCKMLGIDNCALYLLNGRRCQQMQGVNLTFVSILRPTCSELHANALVVANHAGDFRAFLAP